MPFCDAGKFGVMCVDRKDEFAPVKNADAKGKEVQDSPSMARRLIGAQHRRWIEELSNLDASLKADTFVEVDLLLSYGGEGSKLHERASEMMKDVKENTLYIK